jgi:sulfite dehydrogenase (cytochrome) subunit B
MKRALIILILIVAAIGYAYAQEKKISVPVVKFELAAGEGRDKAETLCNICHSADYITMQPRASKAAWAGAVTKMIKVFGAPISDADAAIITKYLAANYGNGK